MVLDVVSDISRLKEKTSNMEKLQNRDMQELKDSNSNMLSEIGTIGTSILEINNRITNMFSINIKKMAMFLVSCWFVAVTTYLGTSWAKSKFEPNIITLQVGDELNAASIEE